MQIDMVLDWVQHFGYPALFFALWLGIVGMPIPDEAVVMIGGLTASLGFLHPIPAFLVTYLGVVSGLSVGYVVGRIMGKPVIERLNSKKNLVPYVIKSTKLLDRYGSMALVIGYYLPVVRHVIPYLMGLSKMSFPRYALFSYTTGFIWTLIYFIIGHFFGDNIEEISRALTLYGRYIILAGLLIGLPWLARFYKKKAVM